MAPTRVPQAVLPMAAMHARRVLLALLAAAAVCRAAAQGSGTPTDPVLYTLDVTVGPLSSGDGPDCFARDVILVNGKFQPTITLTQGDWVELEVINNIPPSWPTVAKGITIHWHGFSMKTFPWMDGTKYVSQCPIAAGTSFKYRFQVQEMPGTYFWHDHATYSRADGLHGPLIVKERAGTPELYPSDGEHVMFLNDWWHFPGNSLAYRLNRPFDPNQATPASGNWCWVGLPKSLLINGKGNYYFCEDPYTRAVGQPIPYYSPQVNATSADLLTPCVSGQLGGTAVWPRCKIDPEPPSACQSTYTTYDVVAGSTYRFRLVNAAMLVYMTVCFQSHPVTVVALDGAPVAPRTFFSASADAGCVDVNTGQRLDVLLTASQAAGAFWVSVGSQYRKGAPATYAVLRYSVEAGLPSSGNILQPQALATGPVTPWDTATTMGFAPPPVFMGASISPADRPKALPYLWPASPSYSFKLPTTRVDQRFVIQSTQPVLEANGILRWALDNVADAVTPPCQGVLDSVKANPAYPAPDQLLPTSATGPRNDLYFSPMGGGPESWLTDGTNISVIDASGPNNATLLNLNKPGAATHIVRIKAGLWYEFVIQNNRAGAYGGEYASSSPLTSNRNGREQHSFHLHGAHFWLVGMGPGEWTPASVNSSAYNLASPVLRDTATVLPSGTVERAAGWVAFRFYADNPGVFPLHCHIAWHEWMGQGLNVVADGPAISRASRPAGMPACPAKCLQQFANYNPNGTQQLYDPSVLAPDNGNLP